MNWQRESGPRRSGSKEREAPQAAVEFPAALALRSDGPRLGRSGIRERRGNGRNGHLRQHKGMSAEAEGPHDVRGFVLLQIE